MKCFQVIRKTEGVSSKYCNIDFHVDKYTFLASMAVVTGVLPQLIIASKLASRSVVSTRDWHHPSLARELSPSYYLVLKEMYRKLTLRIISLPQPIRSSALSSLGWLQDFPRALFPAMYLKQVSYPLALSVH